MSIYTTVLPYYMLSNSIFVIPFVCTFIDDMKTVGSNFKGQGFRTVWPLKLEKFCKLYWQVDNQIQFKAT
jgi:hypothetical protein